MCLCSDTPCLTGCIPCTYDIVLCYYVMRYSSSASPHDPLRCSWAVYDNRFIFWHIYGATIGTRFARDAFCHPPAPNASCCGYLITITWFGYYRACNYTRLKSDIVAHQTALSHRLRYRVVRLRYMKYQWLMYLFVECVYWVRWYALDIHVSLVIRLHSRTFINLRSHTPMINTQTLLSWKCYVTPIDVFSLCHNNRLAELPSVELSLASNIQIEVVEPVTVLSTVKLCRTWIPTLSRLLYAHSI